ncbi:MAG: fibronectin type III domain-containing protein [Candidatus Berkelbacteria bacterium]|nr:fibronectin type III domain-containing protein [Candidatus Berkelbacteria bacterium]
MIFKKIVLASIVFLIIIPVYQPQKTKAVSNPDQACPHVFNTGFYTYASRWPVMVFKPKYNTIDGVDIRIKQVFNEGRGANVKVEILDFSVDPTHVLGSSTQLITTDEEIWQVYALDDISVVPEREYALKVSSPELEHAEWIATGDTSCYTRGYAMDRYSARLNDRIFGFATYGRNVAASTPVPAADNSNPGTGNDQSADSNSGSTDQNSLSNESGDASSQDQLSNPAGVTTGSNQSPSATISKSIESPKDLTGLYGSSGFVKLDWKASGTKNIDGYKIYRSDKLSTDFKEIAKTPKDILSYKDTKYLKNKNNYYFVRTYKGNDESASSNTANVSTKSSESNTAFGIYALYRMLPGLIIFTIFVCGLIGFILLLLLMKKKNKVQPVNQERK